MIIFGWIVLANVLISVLSLVAAFFLSLSVKKLKTITLWLVSLAAGSLLGGAFWHLLPEAIEVTGVQMSMFLVVFSFVGFYIVEKIIHWQHCHDAECQEHSFGYINLVGDGIHNFIDGLSIAAAFTLDFNLGVATTLAIALHEIPQEMGDLGVLMHAGFSRKKALFSNVMVGLMSVAGGVLGYFLAHVIDGSIVYLLPIAAGGFIYLAASDLIPELKREESLRKSTITLGFLMLGLAIMYLALFFEAS
jgi:zinc and cadmium transporter